MKFRRASEAQILSIFYALTVEQRLARFGAPSSDWAIQSWRSKIDRAYYLPVIWEQGRQLVGLVELFGSERTGWKRPELALALGRAGDTSRVRQQLLEIGLGTARELGAVDVLMCFNAADISARALALQCGGKLDHDSGTAVVPCDPVATDGLRSWHSLNAEVA